MSGKSKADREELDIANNDDTLLFETHLFLSLTVSQILRYKNEKQNQQIKI